MSRQRKTVAKAKKPLWRRIVKWGSLAIVVTTGGLIALGGVALALEEKPSGDLIER